MLPRGRCASYSSRLAASIDLAASVQFQKFDEVAPFDLGSHRQQENSVGHHSILSYPAIP
jgi:hypothetical protein